MMQCSLGSTNDTRHNNNILYSLPTHFKIPQIKIHKTNIYIFGFGLKATEFFFTEVMPEIFGLKSSGELLNLINIFIAFGGLTACHIWMKRAETSWQTSPVRGLNKNMISTTQQYLFGCCIKTQPILNNTWIHRRYCVELEASVKPPDIKWVRLKIVS